MSKVDEVDVTGKASSRQIWNGNFNIYWLIGTGVGVWFLFVHSPIYFSERPNFQVGADLVLHLLGAYIIYLVCIWNTFHTPSHGQIYKTLHIVLGRIAMAMGYLSFIFGAYAAWKPDTHTPSGLAIGLTVGGSMQVIVQTAGLYAIYKYRRAEEEKAKESALRSHIYCMFGLFLPACGTPAAMRLGAEFGLDLAAGLGIFITIFVLMIPLGANAVRKQRWY